MKLKIAAVALTASLAWAAVATAEDFHGYDPATFDGAMLSAENLMAMVADAMKVSPPKNGKNYVVGFANLQRAITFCAKVEEGIVANAKAAGIELVIADNNLDGATALTNAESFINRNVDYVIEFQTDANFGATIMQKMKDAGITVVAIDIPMPGATFFGVNNPKAGFMGGSYLAQAAIAKWGADKVKSGYFLEGELPQSGPIPQMRTDGQVKGFTASVDGFDASHVLTFDIEEYAGGDRSPRPTTCSARSRPASRSWAPPSTTRRRPASCARSSRPAARTTFSSSASAPTRPRRWSTSRRSRRRSARSRSATATPSSRSRCRSSRERRSRIRC